MTGRSTLPANRLDPTAQDRIEQPFAHRGVVASDDSGQLTRNALVTTDGNRWSRPGEPTIYMASDAAVALAEFARHWDGDSAPPAIRIWTIDVVLDRIVDLRHANVRGDGAASDDPRWPLDRERCRSLAASFRRQGVQGLIVPSVAFLDQPQRWNLVVFADRLESMERSLAEPRSSALLARAESPG